MIETGATFNELRTHRQRLWRIWDPVLPKMIVVGMNPSKANENDNDPTVARCERRARIRGYGSLVMINMQDVIETDSRKLDQMPSHLRCSVANSAELMFAIEAAANKDADILCGWGKQGQKYGPVAWFTTQAYRRSVTLFCLNRNKDGSPAHPLYQAYSKDFEWFGGVSACQAREPLTTPEQLKMSFYTILPRAEKFSSD